MAKQCWSQTVLESGSWGHSVLQTPALVCFLNWIAWECISKPSSVILQANFHFISAISYISITSQSDIQQRLALIW